jgi:hypothetical protein
MGEKNYITIGEYTIECTDPTMSFQEFSDRIEEIVMREMAESIAGPLLVPLYYFFDSGERPISATEFCDFWASLDPFEQWPFLVFSENELLPTKAK